MSRAVWFVAGAAAGTYAAFRARRAAEVLTPDGLRDRAAGLGLGAQLFAAEVRAGAAEKETELRARLQPVGSQVGPQVGTGRHRPELTSNTASPPSEKQHPQEER